MSSGFGGDKENRYLPPMLQTTSYQQVTYRLKQTIEVTAINVEVRRKPQSFNCGEL